jgi:hypothetical protein
MGITEAIGKPRTSGAFFVCAVDPSFRWDEAVQGETLLPSPRPLLLLQCRHGIIAGVITFENAKQLRDI